MKPETQGWLVGLAGAIAGSILGCFLFLWIAQHGFYALMLPGGLVGIGGSLFARNRSVPRGIVCGFIGLITGLVSEWRFSPFIKDPGLVYFLTHVHSLQTITLLMIGGGAIFAGWFAVGRDKPQPSGSNSGAP